MKSTVGFTVRIPSSLHRRIKKVLKKEKRSLNSIVGELIEEWLRKEQEKELFEAFGKAGDEDVEYAFDAQKEVALSDERTEKK